MRWQTSGFAHGKHDKSSVQLGGTIASNLSNGLGLRGGRYVPRRGRWLTTRSGSAGLLVWHGSCSLLWRCPAIPGLR
jgi:hypothetical protein